MLVVSCRSLSAADASRQPMYEMRRRHEEQYGDFMGFLQDQYGHGDHLVAVFGRDDSLIVPHSVVERWSHEYEVEGVGYAADNIDNPWAASEPVYVEARRNRAKGVLRFTSPATYSSFSSSSITLYSDSDNVVSAEAEEHLVQMARMNHAMLRGLLDSAADLTGEWHRKQVEAAKEHLRHNVKMMKTVYRGKAMPPDVAAFVEECDNRFGQL